MQALDLPAHVGPCELSELGKLVAVRCPAELAHILRRAGAVWEPGSRRWLVQRRRIRVSDPGSGARHGPAVPPRGLDFGMTARPADAAGL
jgi:hypothetical protein